MSLARSTVLHEAVALGEPTVALVEEVGKLYPRVLAGDETSRQAFADAGARNIMGWATGSGRIEFGAMLLGAAVALNDAEATQVLRAYYEDSTAGLRADAGSDDDRVGP